MRGQKRLHPFLFGPGAQPSSGMILLILSDIFTPCKLQGASVRLQEQTPNLSFKYNFTIQSGSFPPTMVNLLVMLCEMFSGNFSKIGISEIVLALLLLTNVIDHVDTFLSF